MNPVMLAWGGCIMCLAALGFLVLDRKQFYTRWVPTCFLAIGACLLVLGLALGAKEDVGAPQALATPSFEVLMSYPCMDGGMPWNDNGRASCLTREQSIERDAKVAEAIEKAGGAEKIIERLCANSLTMHICIEISEKTSPEIIE